MRFFLLSFFNFSLSVENKRKGKNREGEKREEHLKEENCGDSLCESQGEKQ